VHIPDGWVDLPTSAGAAIVAGGALAVAGRRTASRLKERATTLPAVLAAYLLVAQLPAIPLGVGTTAHLVGTGLATALVGPSIAIVCVATVVVVQALVLADGGVTAMGLNLLVNGVAPALVAAAALAAARRTIPSAEQRLPVLAGVAAGLATMTAAATAGAVLAVGGTDVIPPGTVAAVLGAAHVVVAIGEAVLTAGIVGVVVRLRPDLVRHGTVAAARAHPPAGAHHRAPETAEVGNRARGKP
jgi:cobalt/nickel transport system permease protein